MTTPIIVRETEDGLFVGLLPTVPGINSVTTCRFVSANGDIGSFSKPYERFMAETYEITDRQKARFVRMMNDFVRGGGDYVSVNEATPDMHKQRETTPPPELDYTASFHAFLDDYAAVCEAIDRATAGENIFLGLFPNAKKFRCPCVAEDNASVTIRIPALKKNDKAGDDGVAFYDNAINSLAWDFEMSLRAIGY